MRHMFNNPNHGQDGFTLFELMVVVVALAILAPLVLTSLGSLFMDNISSMSKTTQDTSTLNTLQSIKNELDGTEGWISSLAVNKPLGPTNSTSISETWSYCGRNGSSDCTQPSADRVLIAFTAATDKAPTDTSRLPLFADTAGNCDPNNTINPVKVVQIYFVAPDLSVPGQNDLYRRTIVNPAGDTICNGTIPYQTTTCTPAVFSAANCKDTNGNTHPDAVILTNVSSFKVDYYAASKDSAAITNEYAADPAVISDSRTVGITVTSQVRINGTLTSNTANIRITRPL